MIPRLFAVFLAAVALDVAPSPDGCDCDDNDSVGLDDSHDNLEDGSPSESSSEALSPTSE